MTPTEVERLVAFELVRFRDEQRRAAMERLLVAPTAHERTSQYGGGTFACWVVAGDDQRKLVLVHCRGPFGDPWGCLPVASADLGTDAEWFARLEDAFIFGMWDGPLPQGYEVE